MPYSSGWLGETIRVNTEKIDALMAGMGEFLVARMRLEERLAEIQAFQSSLSSWDKKWRQFSNRQRRVLRRLEMDLGLNPLLDFLQDNERHLKASVRKIEHIKQVLEADYRHFNLSTEDLQDGVRKIRMVPIAELFEQFPRMVRDIARDKGKEVELTIKGTATEIDRQVLEKLKDPLTHLLRNAVDHGIESPDARRKLGKSAQGRITLQAAQKGSDVIIQVQDDGTGINLESVQRTALSKGLIRPEEREALSEQETVNLIFQSGLSTQAEISDLSGRGVGLDVVRDRLEKLHGQIEIETQQHEGTLFKLVMPLTLATSQVLFLQVSEQIVAVPTTSVERILHLNPDQIGSMEGRPAVTINGQALPLHSMASVLELPSREDAAADEHKIPVLVLGAVEKKMAFQVEAFLGTQEVVVKNLGHQLKRVRNVAGGTILGTGQVVMILNVGSLMKSAQSSATGKRLKKYQVRKPVRKKILVVDDSITTRTLEKNILENAGYQVSLAADGQEGWDIMQNEAYEAVVFDIEMPRMDGFDLTKRVRKDNRFHDLPVILVTSLESSEDKIKGMDAGADAYITKGTFDQQELLETIERLIG